MTVEELQQELSGKTSIQKEALLKNLYSNNFEVNGSIGDIKNNRISLVSFYSFSDESPYDRFNDYNFKLNFKNETFGKELLSYQNGDDVKIIAKLIGFNYGKYQLEQLEFDLVSISKIGTTVHSRRDAYHKSNQGFCFIATACYGNYNAPEVLVFRKYRDTVLLKSKPGKIAIAIYYFLSPPFAIVISKSRPLKYFVKKIILQPIIKAIT